jgi:hypothetical protein
MRSGSNAARAVSVRAFVGFFGCLCLLWAGLLRADALDGQFEVRTAFIQISGGVFLLHAEVQYPSNDAMRSALADGVTLAFDLDVVVERDRRFWFDGNVVELGLQRQLEYHSVSGRYIVREAGRSEQRSFPTLEAALEDLGKVEAWPVLTEPQLVAGADYRIAIRASMRRGKLNDALRALLFWTDNWQRNSEWYEWSLLR